MDPATSRSGDEADRDHQRHECRQGVVIASPCPHHEPSLQRRRPGCRGLLLRPRSRNMGRGGSETFHLRHRRFEAGWAPQRGRLGPARLDLSRGPRWRRAPDTVDRPAKRRGTPRPPVFRSGSGLRIQPPGCDHRKDEDAAMADQVSVDAGVALADLRRDMGDVEFDRATTSSLEVDEQRAVVGVEDVPRVWLAVQQLLPAPRPAMAHITRLNVFTRRSRSASPSSGVGRGSQRVAELH